MKTFTNMAEDWLLKRNIDQRASKFAESTSSVRPLNPADYINQLHRWALERCEYSAQWSTSIAALYCDFDRWFDQQDKLPPDESVFERLVLEEGFPVADGLVRGLTLRADVRNLHAQTYAVWTKNMA